MSNLLDVESLSFISSIISMVLCICMIYVLQTRRTYRGFGHWTSASVLYMIAMALLGLRSRLPDLVSIVLANSLIVTGNGLIAGGLEIFTGIRNRFRLFTVLTAATVLFFLCFTYVFSSVTLRIIYISAVISMFYGYSAFIVHRFVPELIGEGNRFLVYAFGIQVLWLLLRIAQVALSKYPITDFMRSTSFQGITMIVFFSGNILVVTGLIVLNFQRVEFDLSLAREEVRTLRGLVPICSHCKNIRDENGEWKNLEEFVSGHSEAEFSHSICPDCAREHYPDIPIYSDDGYLD